ncbi:MAG: hypothetical protein AAGF84_07030 [Planctomycetota bacterium]
MNLFTIVIQFRDHQRTFQVRARSAKDAVRSWADGIETSKIPNFGDLSKNRLMVQLERMGLNASDDLPGVWTWVATISGFVTSIVIVATDERQHGGSAGA